MATSHNTSVFSVVTILNPRPFTSPLHGMYTVSPVPTSFVKTPQFTNPIVLPSLTGPTSIFKLLVIQPIIFQHYYYMPCAAKMTLTYKQQKKVHV